MRPAGARRGKHVLGPILALVVICALLAACAAQRKAVQHDLDYPGEKPALQAISAESVPKGAPDASRGVGDIADRRVVKTAELRLDVEDAVKTSATIASRAEALGGYVAGAGVSRSREGSTEAHVTVRVPVHSFTTMIDEIEKMGTLMSRQIGSRDVTEEYVDLEARVANLKVQEKRLQEIASRAGTVEDLLKVEQELGRVRGEIESLTGRLNLLKNQCDFSTISVYLRSTPLAGAGISTSGAQGLWGRAVRALYSSLTTLIVAGSRAIVALFGALPYLVLLAVAGWGAWRTLRRRLVARRIAGSSDPPAARG